MACQLLIRYLESYFFFSSEYLFLLPCLSCACGHGGLGWSLVAQTVKRLPARWETQVHPPEKEMATDSSILQFSSVQSLSRVQLFATPWIAARQASLSITNSGVHPDSRPSSQWCHPAISSSVVPFSSCPQSLPASVFSSESTLRVRWPKYWSFSFSIIPSKEIPGLISFRMDWLDLLAVQGTLKSLLQHHSY